MDAFKDKNTNSHNFLFGKSSDAFLMARLIIRAFFSFKFLPEGAHHLMNLKDELTTVLTLMICVKRREAWGIKASHLYWWLPLSLILTSIGQLSHAPERGFFHDLRNVYCTDVLHTY
uniref:Uncharacterized protein n=1 Tax=Anthurium amnicola TaxID=1678845 RepID=A0A1D1ZCW0_9ARAE